MLHTNVLLLSGCKCVLLLLLLLLPPLLLLCPAGSQG
jgi:hypothetical protein